mmetsp:Transcript_67495/g.107189  ORF Transcript_67495/g.107189 Transcript_67495/m.107189 type:complete len:203 (-) Transcript_67495:29-637(-)
MKDIALLWKSKVFLLLIPIGISAGLTQTLVAGEYATMIEDHALKFYALAVEAFVTSICSWILGKASDKWGSLYPTVLSCAVFVGVVVFFYFWTVDQDALAVWFIIAVLFGIGEAGQFTLVPQIFPILLGDTNAVFANFRILTAIGLCIGFAYYPVTTPMFRLSFNLVIVALSAVCLLLSKDIRAGLGAPTANAAGTVTTTVS